MHYAQTVLDEDSISYFHRDLKVSLQSELKLPSAVFGISENRYNGEGQHYKHHNLCHLYLTYSFSGEMKFSRFHKEKLSRSLVSTKFYWVFHNLHDAN